MSLMGITEIKNMGINPPPPPPRPAPLSFLPTKPDVPSKPIGPRNQLVRESSAPMMLMALTVSAFWIVLFIILWVKVRS